MNYNVKTIDVFERQAKRLAKKYVSLKSDLISLINSLKQNPQQGTSLGNNCYKIRIAISSKGRGKSGGGKVITHIVISDRTVYLLSIYDKSEKESLTDKELKEILRRVFL